MDVISRSLLLVAILFVGTVTAVRGSAHHDHDHDHSTESEELCPITEDGFKSGYSALVEDMGIFDPETGQSCSLEDSDLQGQSLKRAASNSAQLLGDYEVCDTLFNFSIRLLVGLNASLECCLNSSLNCSETDHDHERSVDTLKAYGYGTMMVVGLSLLSLLGIIIVPLMTQNKHCGRSYEYVNLFMVALGTSALFNDAILHLIPHVFESVQEEGEARHLAIAWRACVITAGMYLFYVFETILHKLTQHCPHRVNSGDKSPNSEETESNDPSLYLIKGDHHVSFGHGSIEDPSIAFQKKDPTKQASSFLRKCNCCDIKPLAVLIIVGDGFHNFADGLALGASISQSFALGVSTLIALVFHEIPHELGDFAILLSTGMRWYKALFFNFLSSLTALAGFYIGVSVGSLSQVANGWILAVAAGTFLYISLVDLLPFILHSKLTGIVAVVLAHLGFLLSFVILLVLAIFEEKLGSLISDQ